MTRITMLGAGAMGSRIARNFLHAGHTVTLYNRSPERLAALQAAGAMLAKTPREAAEGAEVVVAMVRDDEASRAVWLAPDLGAIHGVGAGTIALESSTVTPGWVKELAATIGSTGAAFLEAPVLGTRPQAEAAQLIYLIGGEATVLSQVADVLRTTSSAIHHVGAVGAGAAMKLAVNVQYSAQVAIWAETLALLEQQDIAPARAVDVLNTLPTTSPALQVAGKLMVAKNYAAMFPIDLVEKDLSYAFAAAHAVGAHTPMLEAVRALYAAAKAQGYGHDNIIGVKQVFDALSSPSHRQDR